MSNEAALATFLHAKAARQGIPVSGNFELTRRCNFNCKMCYVHSAETCCFDEELTGRQWLDIAEGAKQSGTVFLLLTGGEPLVRNDFEEIWVNLKKMGFALSLNTNASLITPEILELFRRYPPMRVNVSLYGASDETYQSLCGNKAFSKVVGNISALKELDIQVKLSASVTEQNYGDLPEIFRISREFGCYVQTSAYMFPPVRRDISFVGAGDRVSPETAALYSVGCDSRRYERDEYLNRARATLKGISIPDPEDECRAPGAAPIDCRAGKCTFWINFDGTMTPCGMMFEPTADVVKNGFASAWESIKEQTALLHQPAECVSCNLKNICSVCAAKSLAETGSCDKKPEYLCRMTKEIIKLTEKELEKTDE